MSRSIRSTRLPSLLRTGAALGLVASFVGGGVAVADEPEPIRDTTGPIIRVTGILPGEVYADGQTVVLEYTCEDPETGIISCTERSGIANGDSVTLRWLAETGGTQGFLVTAVNGAGMEATDYVLVTVSRGATTSSEAQVPPGDVNGWYRDPVTMTVVGSDSGDRDVVSIYYDFGSGWMQTAGSSAELLFESEGVHAVRHYAMNEDAERGPTQETLVRLDFTAPDIDSDASEFFDDGIVLHRVAASTSPVLNQHARVPFVFTCTDVLSGVASCGGDLVIGELLPTDTVGEHSYTVRSVDLAGNAAERVVRYTVVAAPALPDDGGTSPNPPTQPEVPAPTAPAPAPPAPAARPTTATDSLAMTGSNTQPLPLLLALLALAAGGAIGVVRLARAQR